MSKIGIIVRSDNSSFDRRVLAGAQRTASDMGCGLELDVVGDGPPTIQPMNVDGILTIGQASPPRFLRTVHDRAQTPVVLISGSSGELTIPSVQFDNALGIRLLVRHLVEDCGRKNLLYIGGAGAEHDTRERDRCFQEEVLRYDLPPARAFDISDNDDLAAIRDRLREHFRHDPKPDGIVVANYIRAALACDMLIGVGYDVPEKVAIAAFTDAVEVEDPSITTTTADPVQLGEAGVRQLCAQMNGTEIGGVTRLAMSLTIRQTTCKPN